MFANCQMGGINLAAPDVCKTPVGSSIVPIPYPNTALGATANPSTVAKKVLISGAPAHNLQTVISMSNGDNAGVVGGVKSGQVMGPSRHTMGANSVLIGGSPATKLTDMTGQNGSSSNITGATIAPAQTTVMIMKGDSPGGSKVGGATDEGSPTRVDPTDPVEEDMEEEDEKTTDPIEEVIIVVDPGHGGTKKVGGSSPNNATSISGDKEKDLVLAMGLEIRSVLNNKIHNGKKIKLILTRDTDINVGLADRCKIANANQAKLYLSLHFNGYHTASARGVEAVINSNINNSHAFAKLIASHAHDMISQHISTVLRHGDGVLQQSLGALRGATMPAALLESEFLTYPPADKLFHDATFLKAYSQHIADGLLIALDTLC